MLLRVIMVAPYTGAWIEIILENGNFAKRPVAPYTGAWIEIYSLCMIQKGISRTLHGCVD